MYAVLICYNTQLGKQLPECKLAEEEVLLLLERVNEAQRLATREVKEQLAARDGNRRGRGRYNDGDEDGEARIRGEMTRGYAGGSGGRGGGYHNQRGSKSRERGGAKGGRGGKRKKY